MARHSFSNRPIPCKIGLFTVALGVVILIFCRVYNNDHPDEPHCPAINGGITSWFTSLGYSTIALGLILLIWSGGITWVYNKLGMIQEAFFFHDTCYGAFGRFLVLAASTIHMCINAYGHSRFNKAHSLPVQTEHEEHKWDYCAPGFFYTALFANVIIAITWACAIIWTGYTLYQRFWKEPGVSRKVFSEEKWGRVKMILRKVRITGITQEVEN